MSDFRIPPLSKGESPEVEVTLGPSNPVEFPVQIPTLTPVLKKVETPVLQKVEKPQAELGFAESVGASSAVSENWPYPHPMVRKGKDLQVGDIAVRQDRQFIRSGAQAWTHAVVVSVTPFVLVSMGADMRWEKTIDIEDFQSSGKATSDALKKCQTRINM